MSLAKKDKNFLRISQLNDLSDITASSIIIEVIRTVLKLFIFFTVRFYKYKKAFFLSISP